MQLQTMTDFHFHRSPLHIPQMIAEYFRILAFALPMESISLLFIHQSKHRTVRALLQGIQAFIEQIHEYLETEGA